MLYKNEKALNDWVAQDASAVSGTAEQHTPAIEGLQDFSATLGESQEISEDGSPDSIPGSLDRFRERENEVDSQPHESQKDLPFAQSLLTILRSDIRFLLYRPYQIGRIKKKKV